MVFTFVLCPHTTTPLDLVFLRPFTLSSKEVSPPLSPTSHAVCISIDSVAASLCFSLVCLFVVPLGGTAFRDKSSAIPNAEERTRKRSATSLCHEKNGKDSRGHSLYELRARTKNTLR
jgi:hypothetical protein